MKNLKNLKNFWRNTFEKLYFNWYFYLDIVKRN